MNKLLEIRERHQDSDISELTEKIVESLKAQKKEDERRKQKFAEQDIGIKTVSSKLKSIVDELDNSDKALENKVEELRQHKEEMDQLVSELNQVEAEVDKLQLKKEQLIKKKPSLRDQSTLEQGVSKYNLLKEITGIRWNYEMMDVNTSGYVHKEDTKYVHHFQLDSKVKNEKVKEALWEEIEKSTEAKNVESEKDKE